MGNTTYIFRQLYVSTGLHCVRRIPLSQFILLTSPSRKTVARCLIQAYFPSALCHPRLLRNSSRPPLLQKHTDPLVYAMVLLDSLPPEILRRIAELLSNDDTDHETNHKTTIGNMRHVNNLFAQVALPYFFRRFNFSNNTRGISMYDTRFFLRIVQNSPQMIAAYTESARFNFDSKPSLEPLTSEELALDHTIWQEGIRTLGLPPSRGCLEPAPSDKVLPWSAGYRASVEGILNVEYGAVCTTLLLSHMVNLQTLEINVPRYYAMFQAPTDSIDDDKTGGEACWHIPRQFPFKLHKLQRIVWNKADNDFQVHLAVITPLFITAPNLVHLAVHGGFTSNINLSADDHPLGSGQAFSSVETLDFRRSRIDVAYLAWLLPQTKQLRTFCYTMTETDGSAGYNPEEMGKALLEVRETIEDLEINRGSLYWVLHDPSVQAETDNRLLGAFKNFPKLRRLAVDFLSLVVVDDDGVSGEETLLDVIPPGLEYLELHHHVVWWHRLRAVALFLQLLDVVSSDLFRHLKEVQVLFYVDRSLVELVPAFRVVGDAVTAFCLSMGIRCRVQCGEDTAPVPRN
jgi:hypothetical protein